MNTRRHPKPNRARRAWSCLLAIPLLLTSSGSAGEGVSIRKQQHVAGGGRSEGQGLVVSGSIRDGGEPMRGGSITLNPGFWSPAGATQCAPTEAAAAVLPSPQSRYITIEPKNAGRMTAIRVTLDEIHVPDPPVIGSPDFSAFGGQVRWVGPPSEYPEGASATPSFYAAQLQCEPHFADWSQFGTISVYGDAVVPSSSYTVQAIDQSCEGAIGDEASYSAGLAMTTSRWGDVTEPFQPPSTFTQPNINDILLVVDKFLGAFPPLKSSTQLLGNVPDPNVKPDINDILLVVDSFLGQPYPYAGPSVCP